LTAAARFDAGMSVSLLKHETVPGTGSYEVRFANGRRSAYFYFDDFPSRRLRPEQMPRAQARDQAKMFARIMRGVIEGWRPSPKNASMRKEG
jgi:hypothetical protein